MNKFNEWKSRMIETDDIYPIKFGISQDEVLEKFGDPDAVSIAEKNGRPLILKYEDIEFHFDDRHGHRLFLIYSDDLDLSIIDRRNHVRFPILTGTQVALLRVRFRTGQALDEMFAQYDSHSSGKVYSVFENREAAEGYVADAVKTRKDIEFIIYDAARKPIFHKRPAE